MSLRLEDPIRTLGVGLMTLAAMLVSLSVARQRSDLRRDEADPAATRPQATPALNLDAIRSAGF